MKLEEMSKKWKQEIERSGRDEKLGEGGESPREVEGQGNRKLGEKEIGELGLYSDIKKIKYTVSVYVSDYKTETVSESKSV